MLEILKTLGFTPRSCVWELTLACNMRCQHCGSIAGERRADELTRDELLDVADQLADLGCRRVTLSGGEPTMNPAWHEVGRRLTDRHVKANIISNGWSWSERHARQALDAGLVSAAFSLDGFQEEHDRLRGLPGSYERVLKAIEACVAAGLPVAVNTTINRLNQGLLPRMRELLLERGVFAWQLQFGTPAGNMAHHRELVVPGADYLTLIPLIAELCRENTPKFFIVPSDDIGYYGQPEQDLRGGDASLPFWLGCRAGCQVIGIESNGNVKGCLSLPSSMHGESRFLEGNLRRERLAAIWHRADAFSYNRQFREDDLVGFCRVCRFRDVCRGGCTWTKHCGLGPDGNETCFYFQAVKHGRHELLGEEPTAPEKAYFSAPRP